MRLLCEATMNTIIEISLKERIMHMKPDMDIPKRLTTIAELSVDAHALRVVYFPCFGMDSIAHTEMTRDSHQQSSGDIFKRVLEDILDFVDVPCSFILCCIVFSCSSYVQGMSACNEEALRTA